MSDFQVLPPKAAGFQPALLASLAIHLAAALPHVLRGPATAERHDPIDRMVVFLVPPTQPGTRPDRAQGIDWSGLTAGRGAATDEATTRAEVPEQAVDLGTTEASDTIAPAPDLSPAPEAALTEIEVDSAVVRDPTSAAPIYPEELLKKSVEGATFVHYVVDTTGRVDTNTIEIVRTSHPEFALSVREALGLMKFRPAVQGSRRVRQWVEQNFAFRIVPRNVPPADTT